MLNSVTMPMSNNRIEIEKYPQGNSFNLFLKLIIMIC
jgi:hypothetical protein